MKNNEMDDPIRQRKAWNIPRIAIGGALGVTCAAYIRAFDFWPLGYADELRELLDLLGFPALCLAIVGVFIFWVISAIVAFYQRRLRDVMSSILAITIVPASVVLLLVAPIFDPWLWYVVFNKSRFEATAAMNSSAQNGRKYFIVEERDITTGMAGVTTNHFVALIYSEGDPATPDSTNSVLTHIYGNFYRRDEFQ